MIRILMFCLLAILLAQGRCHADQLTLVRNPQAVPVTTGKREVTAPRTVPAPLDISEALLSALTEYTPPSDQFNSCGTLAPAPVSTAAVTEKSPVVILAGSTARIKIGPLKEGVLQDYSLGANGLPPVAHAVFITSRSLLVPMSLNVTVDDWYMFGDLSSEWYYAARYKGMDFLGYVDPLINPESLLPNYRQTVIPILDCNVIIQIPPVQVLDEEGNPVFDADGNPVYTINGVTSSPCTPTGLEGDECYCHNQWRFSVPWKLEALGGFQVPLSAGIAIAPGLIDITLPPDDTRLLSGGKGFVYVHIANDDAESTFLSALFIPVEVLPTVTEPPL